MNVITVNRTVPFGQEQLEAVTSRESGDWKLVEHLPDSLAITEIAPSKIRWVTPEEVYGEQRWGNNGVGLASHLKGGSRKWFDASAFAALAANPDMLPEALKAALRDLPEGGNFKYKYRCLFSAGTFVRDASSGDPANNVYIPGLYCDDEGNWKFNFFMLDAIDSPNPIFTGIYIYLED